MPSSLNFLFIRPFSCKTISHVQKQFKKKKNVTRTAIFVVKHPNLKIRKNVKFVLFLNFFFFYVLDTELINKLRVGIFADPYAGKSLIDRIFRFEGRMEAFEGLWLPVMHHYGMTGETKISTK